MKPGEPIKGLTCSRWHVTPLRHVWHTCRCPLQQTQHVWTFPALLNRGSCTDQKASLKLLCTFIISMPENRRFGPLESTCFPIWSLRIIWMCLDPPRVCPWVHTKPAMEVPVGRVWHGQKSIYGETCFRTDSEWSCQFSSVWLWGLAIR